MIDNRAKASSEKQRVLGNFFSLSILQGANYILPLITLPYLVRVLGPEKFGLVAFAQAMMYYFVMLTDYGFRLSATREVSIRRNNTEELSKIVSRVLAVEAALMVLSLALLSVIVFGFARLRCDWRVYFFTFGMVLGHAMFPVWFFQGMERMKYITVLSIAARLVFLAAIFVVVRSPSDYVYVPALHSAGLLASGLVSLVVLYRRFGIRPALVRFRDFVLTLREGFPIFLTTILSGQILFSTAALAIGVFRGNEAVGYFSVAHKLLRALVTVRLPITVSLFPFFSKRFEQRAPGTLAHVIKVVILLSAVYVPATIGVALLAPHLISIISGSEYADSAILLRIGVFYVLFNMYNSVAGVIVMINVGLKRELMWIRLVKYVIFLFLLCIVARWAMWGAMVLIGGIELAEMLLYVVMAVRSKGWREYRDAKRGVETADLSL